MFAVESTWEKPLREGKNSRTFYHPAALAPSTAVELQARGKPG
jgi:hypothetical protein